MGGSSEAYRGVRRLFLVGLALVYGAAFLSLWVQVAGLFGQDGLAPVHETLDRLDARFGSGARWRAPSVFWLFRGALAESDLPLHGACGAALVAAGAVAVGAAPRLGLAFLWLLYLSFVSVGDVFLRYQWDALLLETGLLAIGFAPAALRAADAAAKPVSRVALWLLRGLLFKLMFLSGMVKWLSGDPTWRDLTALEYHYWTQPLPTWTSYYVDALPTFFHTAACAATLAIEVALPFLVFAPRRGRWVAFAGFVALQLGIGATGSYGFFNALTGVLCLVLLDDAVFRRVLPSRFASRIVGPHDAPSHSESDPSEQAEEAPGRFGSHSPWQRVDRVRRLAGPVLAALIVVLSAQAILDRLGIGGAGLPPLRAIERQVAPLRSVNSYGLFAVMTTERREIAVEGSRDGREWRRYRFRWKPGDPDRPPHFAGPHMPRVDWQMWFASLRGCERSPWFRRLLMRILEGEPAVLGLLAENPFVGAPPRFVRTPLARYRFARDGSDAWWSAEPLGDFCPPVELAAGRLRVVRGLGP